MANKQSSNLTTSWGAPVDNDQYSITAGEYGPITLTDTHLIDKLSHLNREKIPDRVNSVKGAGAWGYFEVTNDVTQYTRAKFLNTVGKRTPVFTRFSNMNGEKGTPDSERDVRGFAVKFYTEEGNYDFVGQNLPVTFIRDAIKVPDLVHAQKRNPQNNLKDPNMFWDFVSQQPETSHLLSFLFSDRGIPASYRQMNGYGCHTFKWVNSSNQQFWVKLHLKADAGIKNLTNQEADQLKVTNPDYLSQDLFQHIEKGNNSSWTLSIQVLGYDDAFKFRWNVFDSTKVWPHADCPLIPVGKLVLDRNPQNYFQEVEQASFSVSNLVPGIESSIDKLLQGNLFAQSDADRYRLGANYNQIPVNSPYRVTVSNGLRDGQMSINGNQGSKQNYDPSTLHTYVANQEAQQYQFRITGLVGRFKQGHPNCDYQQAGNLFRNVFKAEERLRMIQNIASQLQQVNREIQERQVKLLFRCDAELGQVLSQKLGFPAQKSLL